MEPWLSPPSRARRAALALAVLGGVWLPAAHGFTIGITPGTRALFLQVGAGTMSGGNFRTGGTPGNNTTVNSVSVTVPAGQLGSGTAQAMTTDSTVTISPWDGFAFCNSPATTGQVYVGGFYRMPGSSNAGAATLSVTTPASLTDGGNTIPFNSIAWTSSGNGDTGTTIPSATFAGGAQTLLSVTRNTWFESCLAFRYLNTQLVPAGTFTGRATYTLTAP
ncbi:hypothetical protein SAMN05444679_112108 [Variovorax sp. CF079]|nr:hypothetical protein SAMN05444679_112108 [Variovorax sp. CF079]